MTLAKLKRGTGAGSFADTFETVLDGFIASQKREKDDAPSTRCAGSSRRMLSRSGAAARWSQRSHREDVVKRVEAILDRGKPVAASRFRAWCSKLFSYAVGSQLRADNPAKGVEDPVAPKTLRRSRKLDDGEIAQVWRAAEQLGYPFGPIVQLLMLTGQRLREVAEARWSEFDLEAARWPIPGARAKNGAEHVVALSGPALAVLRPLPRIGRSGFAFTTTVHMAIAGFDREANGLARGRDVAIGARRKKAAAWRHLAHSSRVGVERGRN